MRMKLFELPHLAERTPAQVTAPRFTQAGVGYRLSAVRSVEPRRHLLGRALILDETCFSGPLNRLLIQTHGIGVPPLEAGDLGRHECVFIGESRWIGFGPL